MIRRPYIVTAGLERMKNTIVVEFEYFTIEIHRLLIRNGIVFPAMENENRRQSREYYIPCNPGRSSIEYR